MDGDAVHISAGRAHVCAVLAAGAVACWGENTSGQAESYDPRPVALEGSGIGERGEAGPEPTGAFDDQDPDTDPQVAGLSPWLVGGLPALFVLVVLLVVLLLVARRDRGGAVAVAPVVEPVLAPGQPFLDKYLVKRALGRGAFGTTYLATHVDLKRDVVIKQLRPEWSVQEETRVRFQREAQILAALDHPNITRVFDVERTQNAHFIVMEYVAGGNLKERFGGTIDEGGTTSAADHGAPEADQTQVFAAAAVDRPVVVPGLRVEVAVRILGDVLDGLDYLHGRGVLHRDLKPANVLLTSDGRAKIADFGVSREAGQDASVVTVAGSPLGTPLFMAPEQVLGRPVDARADLYAAAATFYWILAGQPYVGGASTSVHELQRQIVEDPPSLPLVDVPEGLNRWLARGLAKLPEERFQTAREAAEALRCA